MFIIFLIIQLILVKYINNKKYFIAFGLYDQKINYIYVVYTLVVMVAFNFKAKLGRDQAKKIPSKNLRGHLNH